MDDPENLKVLKVLEDEKEDEEPSLLALLFACAVMCVLATNVYGPLLMILWPDIENGLRWFRFGCLLIMYVSGLGFIHCTHEFGRAVSVLIKWLGKKVYEVSEFTYGGGFIGYLFLNWLMCIYYTVYPQPWFDAWIPFRIFWIGVGCSVCTFWWGVQMGSHNLL
jgi:hypothetical protein